MEYRIWLKTALVENKESVQILFVVTAYLSFVMNRLQKFDDTFTFK